MGAHFYLVPLILQPAVLQIGQAATTVLGGDEVKNNALNAAKALARLAGRLDERSNNFENLVNIQRAISKLITPGTIANKSLFNSNRFTGIFHVLDTASTGQDFLFFLQKDHFTPSSYWNRNVMYELLTYVTRWLTGKVPQNRLQLTKYQKISNQIL